MSLMENSFIFRGHVPDDKYIYIDYKYGLMESQCNLLKLLTISYLDNQCLETSLIYYFYYLIYLMC